ncbi:MAG: DUF5057 domain-containing protein [Lachnospiraceae bacterium]|nr:DUF5057 domain-containing protein [Lachnospiraceae bacterium]
MLKSKKSKIIIGALGIVAVLASASIYVSSLFKKTDVDDFDYSLLATADDAATTTLTQIDYIIQEADPYNVLFIADDASDVASVRTFFEASDGFRQYVINDNRTIEQLMDENKVAVTVKTAASYSGQSKTTIADSLSDMDMIFLYGKNASSFTGGNAISEDLYECLHNYISANKPMILSYYQIQNGADVIVTTDESGFDSKAYNLTAKTFKNSWKRTNTTNISDWKIDTAAGDSDGQVQDVIKSYIKSNRSPYIRYYLSDSSVPAGYADWSSYWSRVDGESKLHVLFVYGGDQDGSGNETSSLGQTANIDDYKAIGNWMIDTGVDGGAKFTFNTELTSNYPTNVEVNAVRASDLIVNSADGSIDPKALYVTGAAGAPVKQYDYIFIAPDTYHPSYDLSDDAVSALQTLSSATDTYTYILFGTLKGKTVSTKTTSSSSEHDPFSVGIDTTTNYGKLVDLCVTTTAYSKKSNVLPVGKDYMNEVAANANNYPTRISEIAALINKSNYKTHAGGGSGGGSGTVSTEAFRVLELQPCYPIDLELAANSSISTSTNVPYSYTNKDGEEVKLTGMLSNFTYVDNLNKSNQADTYTWGGYNFTNPLGNYYTIPANVVNSSEIDTYATVDDAKTSATMTQEYYDWDLSKAKIAYALGMSTDQIELVQMSTDEYITAKADAADAYDLIYIGGNMSAFKNSNAYGVDVATADNTIYPIRQESIGVYSMYTHTGEITAVRGEHVGQNGKLAGKFTVMNGNDITYDRYLQMVAYIDAGMPIVFSNEIWEKFNAAESSSNKYANRYIDPDSNIYHLCEYANKKGSDSILEGWATKVRKDPDDLFYKDYYNDAPTKLIENDKGVYGTAAYVSVYADENLNDKLYNCVYKSNMRPKFSLTTTAVTYVEGDASTKLKDHAVSWDITLLNPIAGHSYEAFLVQDQDDNGVFDEKGEKLPDTGITIDGTTGTGTIDYSYPANEFGAFNWKVVVRDSETKATAATSSITVFDISTKLEKMSASILEIMPMTQDNCTSYNPSAPDGHTFYLDKNYQQTSGNPFLFSSYDGGDPELYGHCPSIQSPGTADDGKASTDSAMRFNSNYVAGAYKKGMFNNDHTDVYMGKYKAELSVNRYDTAAGHEDRDYNYMDLVSDMYDFNLDIMYIDDILYYAEVARSSTEAERQTYLQEAAKQYAIYEAYETPGTTEYNALKNVEDPLRKALENIRDGVSFTTPTGYTVDPKNYDAYDIDGMLQSKDYFRFFYLNASLYNPPEPGMIIYNAYYKPYIDEHDKMVVAYRQYRHNSMKAYGADEYLRQNYDVIVIGFMDDYAGDYTDFSQNAVNDLITFTQKKDVKDADGNDLPAGSVLMTHDNMTAFADGSHALNLTSTLRQYAGLNGYTKLTMDSSTSTSKYPKYTSTDSNRYFLTNVSSNLPYVNSSVKDDAWSTVRDLLGLENYRTYDDYKDTYLPSKGGANDVETQLSEFYSGNGYTMPALDASWRTGNSWFDDNAFFSYLASKHNTWQHGLDITIPESDQASIVTVQDLIDYISVKKVVDDAVKYDSILASVESKYSITLNSDARDHISTVSDLVDYIVASQSTVFDFSKNSSLTGTAWNDAVTTWGAKTTYTNAGRTFVPMGFTDIYNVYRTGGYGQTVRYLYAELEMQEAIKYNIQLGGPLNVTGSSKATQVNRGVVTTYPFYIATDLRVSNTHGQAYALDLENQDVAVWYTLAGDNQSEPGKAGGTNYVLMKQNSSMFAASPKDGTDSYYIYSIGNIVYCGAGHSLITGYMRDNNDERRLFLNVLINMAKHSTRRPDVLDDDEIELYDPDGVTKAPGNVVKQTATDGYYINQNSEIDYPEFGFKLKKNDGEVIQSLEVFYDLDYNGTKDEAQNVYSDDANHVMITMTDAQKQTLISNLGANKVVVLTKDEYPTLITDRSYFKPYNYEHTYIVINLVVKEPSGRVKTVSERIKIKLTKDLLDLT